MYVHSCQLSRFCWDNPDYLCLSLVPLGLLIFSRSRFVSFFSGHQSESDIILEGFKQAEDVRGIRCIHWWRGLLSLSKTNTECTRCRESLNVQIIDASAIDLLLKMCNNKYIKNQCIYCCVFYLLGIYFWFSIINVLYNYSSNHPSPFIVTNLLLFQIKKKFCLEIKTMHVKSVDIIEEHRWLWRNFE